MMTVGLHERCSGQPGRAGAGKDHKDQLKRELQDDPPAAASGTMTAAGQAAVAGPAVAEPATEGETG